MSPSTIDRRLIHASPNGDRWWLLRTPSGAAIRYEPNAASGGRASEIAVGAFLGAGAAGPEHRALLDLIGTLAGAAPPAPPAPAPEPGAAAAEPEPDEVP